MTTNPVHPRPWPFMSAAHVRRTALVRVLSEDEPANDAAPVCEWVHPCNGFGGKLLHVPMGEQCDRCGECAEDEPEVEPVTNDQPKELT